MNLVTEISINMIIISHYTIDLTVASFAWIQENEETESQHKKSIRLTKKASIIEYRRKIGEKHTISFIAFVARDWRVENENKTYHICPNILMSVRICFRFRESIKCTGSVHELLGISIHHFKRVNTVGHSCVVMTRV